MNNVLLKSTTLKFTRAANEPLTLDERLEPIDISPWTPDQHLERLAERLEPIVIDKPVDLSGSDVIVVIVPKNL